MPSPAPEQRPAFSLVEILVVIAVVALLLAIALPTLFAVRAQGERVRALSSLRQTSLVLETYTQRFSGAFPFQQPGRPYRLNPDSEYATMWTTRDPWVLQIYWVTLLHDVAPWNEYYALWVDSENLGPEDPWDAEPQDHIFSWVPPDQIYSQSFVSSPATWGGPTDRVHVRATVRHEVRFPADKVVMFRNLRHGSTLRERLFVDGSADTAPDDRASEPVQNLLRIGARPRVYHDTLAGVHGRDR